MDGRLAWRDFTCPPPSTFHLYQGPWQYRKEIRFSAYSTPAGAFATPSGIQLSIPPFDIQDGDQVQNVAAARSPNSPEGCFQGYHDRRRHVVQDGSLATLHLMQAQQRLG